MTDDELTIADLKIDRHLHLVDACYHRRISYDPSMRVVQCKDCGREVEHWAAFMLVLSRQQQTESDLARRYAELEALEKRADVGLLKATRTVDHCWRSQTMVPTCPHCHEAIFPGDKFGMSSTNKKMAIERRRFKEAGK